MRWILAAAPLLLVHPGGLDHLPGVGRSDPRVAVDVGAAPFRGLVRVQTELGGRCTGFLSAPAEVTTAAHCLFLRRSGHFVQPGSIHVLLGYRQGTFAAHAVVARYRIGPGYDPLDETATAGSDWAVLSLPAAIGGADRVVPAQTGAVPDGTPVALAGYGMDRKEVADGDLACAITGMRDGLLTHSCSATLGTSGAPLLTRAADGSWRVIGIQIAAEASGAGGAAVPIGAVSSVGVPDK
jgi:protease YdgD